MTRPHLRVIEPATKRPPVPSLDDRAAYFRRTGQTVAEQVGTGRPSLAMRLTVRAGMALFMGIAWVGKKLGVR